MLRFGLRKTVLTLVSTGRKLQAQAPLLLANTCGERAGTRNRPRPHTRLALDFGFIVGSE